jgi:uncharacterized protein YjeT (DUF2065 family)
MFDFLAAIGLFFAIEGILFAAFPLGTKRAMAAALDMPDGRLRVMGLISAISRHRLAGTALVREPRRGQRQARWHRRSQGTVPAGGDWRERRF